MTTSGALFAFASGVPAVDVRVADAYTGLLAMPQLFLGGLVTVASV